MRQLSPEQQDKVKELRDKKQRREMLQAAIDKINQGIERNNTRSGERAIWELVQNACDLAKNGHAIIKIELKDDGLYFSHQGEPFTIDTLSNLIKQQSTKWNDKDAVGQYGTGFMTTHVFNRKVYISGDCKIDCGDDCIYVPLPNGFCLNRNYKDEETEAFIKEMDSELEIVENLRLASGNDSPCLWTTFHYVLCDEKKAKVSDQLRQVCYLMPFVMVLNDKIQECTIVDNTQNVKVEFTHDERKIINSGFDAKGSLHVSTTILRNENSAKESINLQTIESADRQDVVFIPPMSSMYTDMSKIPSEFLFFPLLGSEDFGTNFIIHSKRMYPKETRDSYLWPFDSDSVIDKYKHNKEVLSEIVAMVFAYYDEDESRQCLPLQFAGVYFHRDTEDEVARAFYDGLQKQFSDKFENWKMIPTKDGFQKIAQNSNIGVLHKDIYRNLSDEQIEKYIPVVANYATKVKTVPSENIVAWSEVVNSWGEDKAERFITLDDICNKIVGTDNQLHNFLSLLNEIGTVGLNLMNEYPLLPNRENKLEKKADLRDGKDITDELYAISSPIIGNRAEVIVSPNFTDIVKLPLYTRKDLQKDLTEAVKELRAQTLKVSPAKELDIAGIQKLISYCSAYPTEEPNSFRSRLMPVICKLYELEYKPIYIAPTEANEEDIYSSTFDYLLEQTMLMLSLKEATWLTTEDNHEEHHSNLVEFVRLYVGDKNNNDRMEKLTSYGIFPNQLGEMCKAKDLKKKDSNIEDDLLEIYKEVFDKDLKEFFVDDNFVGFYEFEELSAKEIGHSLDEKIIELHHDSKDESLIKVLSKFNETAGNKWKNLFPQIYGDRQQLYYSLGSAEDKKAMFTLQLKGSETLQRMAKIAESDNFDDIMNKAEDMVAQQEEFERQFRFTSAIGVSIQRAIQNELGAEIKCVPVKDNEELLAKDVQNGQDIIITYKDLNLYYLECKAKWNFNQPAHMSSQQMKQAVREQKHYALVCVDCTDKTGCNVSPDATEEEVNAQIEDILKHTYVHRDIGELLNDTLSPLVKREDEEIGEESEDTIKIYSNLTCDIPKKKFNDGEEYSVFINWLIDYLKGQI